MSQRVNITVDWAGADVRLDLAVDHLNVSVRLPARDAETLIDQLRWAIEEIGKNQDQLREQKKLEREYWEFLDKVRNAHEGGEA